MYKVKFKKKNLAFKENIKCDDFSYAFRILVFKMESVHDLCNVEEYEAK